MQKLQGPQNNLHNESRNNEGDSFSLYLLKVCLTHARLAKVSLLTIPKYKPFQLIGEHHQISKIVLCLEIRHSSAAEKPEEIEKEEETSTSATRETNNTHVLLNGPVKEICASIL